MAISKVRSCKKDVCNNQKDTYSFDFGKCKICPFKEGCYKDGSKVKVSMSQLNL
jgi:hypothetical protein